MSDLGLKDLKTTLLELVTYASASDIERILRDKSEQLVFAEYIHHDKDTKEDGTPKIPHSHILLELKAPRLMSDVAKWFKKCVDDKGELVTTRYKEILNTASADDYLTHSGDSKGEAGKYQYERTQVRELQGNLEDFRSKPTRTDRLNEAQASKDEKADEVEGLLNDIVRGLPMREMARKYGRDYIKNRKAYTEYAGLMALEEGADLDTFIRITRNPIEEHINELRKEAFDDGVKSGLREVEHIIHNDKGLDRLSALLKQYCGK